MQVRGFLKKCLEQILSCPRSHLNQRHSISGKGNVTYEAGITLTCSTKGVRVQKQKCSKFPVRDSYLKNKRQLETLGSRLPLELYAAKKKLTPFCVFLFFRSSPLPSGGSQPHVVVCLVFGALNSSIRIFQISEQSEQSMKRGGTFNYTQKIDKIDCQKLYRKMKIRKGQSSWSVCVNSEPPKPGRDYILIFLSYTYGQSVQGISDCYHLPHLLLHDSLL